MLDVLENSTTSDGIPKENFCRKFCTGTSHAKLNLSTLMLLTVLSCTGEIIIGIQSERQSEQKDFNCIQQFDCFFSLSRGLER